MLHKRHKSPREIRTVNQRDLDARRLVILAVVDLFVNSSQSSVPHCDLSLVTSLFGFVLADALDSLSDGAFDAQITYSCRKKGVAAQMEAF